MPVQHLFRRTTVCEIAVKRSVWPVDPSVRQAVDPRLRSRAGAVIGSIKCCVAIHHPIPARRRCQYGALFRWYSRYYCTRDEPRFQKLAPRAPFERRGFF